jgi:hypothetical protein
MEASDNGHVAESRSVELAVELARCPTLPVGADPNPVPLRSNDKFNFDFDFEFEAPAGVPLELEVEIEIESRCPVSQPRRPLIPAPARPRCRARGSQIQPIAQKA